MSATLSTPMTFEHAFELLFSYDALIWQLRPLQFGSGGATFSDGGRWQKVLISASNQLSLVSSPFNFTSAQVSDTRKGLEQSQLWGLFQISTGRMAAGRRGPDCFDNLISRCLQEGWEGNPTWQGAAGEGKEGDHKDFVCFYLFQHNKYPLTMGETRMNKFPFQCYWKLVEMNCFANLLGKWQTHTANKSSQTIWSSFISAEFWMNSWWVDPRVWCSI